MIIGLSFFRKITHAKKNSFFSEGLIQVLKLRMELKSGGRYTPAYPRPFILGRPSNPLLHSLRFSGISRHSSIIS
jgi:hypothetical protein